MCKNAPRYKEAEDKAPLDYSTCHGTFVLMSQNTQDSPKKCQKSNHTQNEAMMHWSQYEQYLVFKQLHWLPFLEKFKITTGSEAQFMTFLKLLSMTLMGAFMLTVKYKPTKWIEDNLCALEWLVYQFKHQQTVDNSSESFTTSCMQNNLLYFLLEKDWTKADSILTLLIKEQT